MIRKLLVQVFVIYDLQNPKEEISKLRTVWKTSQLMN